MKDYNYNEKMYLKDLKYFPTVYAVGNDYQIAVYSESEILVGVKVLNSIFYDNSNGVKQSLDRIHKITVPACLINEQKGYSIVYRKVIERKGDYTETLKEEEICFEFKPISEDKDVFIYQIADAHQKEKFPFQAGKYFKDDLSLLVINGDTFDYLNSPKDFEYLLKLSSELTKGQIPVVFAKGNHDNKGKYAEKLTDYTPTKNGKSYFTFRLGHIWGLVLDCGENCDDNTDFYGNTVCHHDFRKEETDFLNSVIKNAKEEYLQDGVKVRIVVSHSAFNNVRCKPFDIETEIYQKWVDLINLYIKPDFMISGHLHVTEFCDKISALNTLGFNYPFVIGSNPIGWQTGVLTDFVGLAITLKKERAVFEFTDSKLNSLEKHELDLRKKILSLDEYLERNVCNTEYSINNFILPSGYENISSITYKTTPNNQVFGFIGYPKKPKPKNGYKAILLVHGGDGYAFYEWVKFWNDLGYVAIAPDFCSGKAIDINERKAFNEKGGPKGYGSIYDFDTDNPWLYHSVLSAKKAIDVLCSLDDIDKNNVYAQGISWGGFISLTMASKEKRLKALSIVYSSAFISDSQWGQNQGIGMLSKENKLLYDYNIDPQTYLKDIKCPVIFSAGCDDGAFTVKNRMRTADMIETETVFSLREHYVHGHEEGWQELEPYAFFENKLKFPIITQDNEKVTVLNSEEFSLLKLVITTEDVEYKDVCNWVEIIFDKTVCIPEKTKFFFVYSEDLNYKSSTKIYKRRENR